VSLLTCELLHDPELMRIANQAYDEVLAEEIARVDAEKKRLCATRNRGMARRAEALRPAVSVEMVASRIHKLTEVRMRLRAAEKTIKQLRADLRAARGDTSRG